MNPRLSIHSCWTDCLHGDGFHSSQSGFLIEQLLDVGSSRALRLRDGAAFLQGPGGMVQPAAQGLQVGVARVPVRVGQEREELGGAEWSWGGTFCCLCPDTFTITQATAVSLDSVGRTRPRVHDGSVCSDRLLPSASWEDWLPINCEGAETLKSEATKPTSVLQLE